MTMTLQEWLDANGIKVVELSDQLGLDHSTLYRILRGERMPSLEVAAVIEYYTGGQVSADSFLKVSPERYMRRWRSEARKSTNPSRRSRAIKIAVRRSAPYDERESASALESAGQ
jgi:transcriptional regulator with XRE-family HTH domain